ncbi:uncharacterized protein LOC127711799 isoform X2 [Mytilus californianus]|uniref:uncharacterized protein LOC127711799 isoform X2 n=1 Tax=Mytilus californianus TaxID=6549 RepID=UPI002246A9E3|nr:uncharacterized protein LOC127711799 isoform X2 [Mytilus californianus]
MCYKRFMEKNPDDSMKILVFNMKAWRLFNEIIIHRFISECKRGSTSWDGGSCLPCKDNIYGIKCLKTCSCNYHQRCDPVIGCVTSTVTSESSTTVTESDETETNANHFTITTLSHSDKVSGPVQTETFSEQITVETTPHNGDENKILSGGWIFSFSLFGIILLICVPHHVRKYMRKSKLQIDRNKGVDKDRNTNKTISLQHHEYIEVDNEYEEIDDNWLDESLFQLKRKNKSVSVESKSSSDRSYFEPKDNGSYLNPCYVPDDESEGGKGSGDSTDYSCYDRDESIYLNPYLALQQPSEIDVHVYEPNIIVHKTTDESSDFESINNLKSYDMSAGSIKIQNDINVSTAATNKGNEYMTMQIRHSREDIHVSKRMLSLEFSDKLFNKRKSEPLALNKAKSKLKFTPYRVKAFHLSYENFYSSEVL